MYKREILQQLLNGNLPDMQRVDFDENEVYTLPEIYAISKFNAYMVDCHFSFKFEQIGLEIRGQGDMEEIWLDSDKDFITNTVSVNNHKYYYFHRDERRTGTDKRYVAYLVDHSKGIDRQALIAKYPHLKNEEEYI